MSSRSKLNLLRSHVNAHLVHQKALNEIMLQNENPTIHMLVLQSEESLTVLEDILSELNNDEPRSERREDGATASVKIQKKIHFPSHLATSTPKNVKYPKKRRSVSVGELCAICLDSVHNGKSKFCPRPVNVLECGHIFHCSCLRGWVSKNNTCPTCRQMIRNLKSICERN